MTKEIDAISRVANVIPDTISEQLEEKLKLVKKKKVLARIMSPKFDTAVGTIYNHWLCGGMTPKIHKEDVLIFITNYLKSEQNGI